jgi:hypothetical protein
MTSLLEYHLSVRHSVPASIALLSLLALPAGLVSNAHAQINGAPASVTSPGFGGRAVNGTAPSVTSLGPRGYTSNPHVPFNGTSRSRNGDGRRHHHYVQYAPPYAYAVPVPYAVDIGETDDPAYDQDSDADYQGGPTILDRRGSGARSYIPPVRDVPPPHAEQPSAAAADPPDPPGPPDPPEVPTLLVFKDGHKIEVGNYAIIGATLFDLTPGHSRKVALADLDLEATRQQNDDRGISFQLPPSAQAN